MKPIAQILKWATDCLVSLGCTIEQQPECVLSTPWSSVSGRAEKCCQTAR